MKQELIRIIREKSFQYNPKPIFKLVSGNLSQFYVNCKPTTLSPRGMFLAGNLVYEAIKDLPVIGVGGLTFGADPISIATAFVSELRNNPIQAFSIRKDKKDHGIVRWIEGDIHKGDAVAIIDDVATTGGSTIKAIQRAQSEGMDVVRAVILIDRQEGGLKNISKHINDVSAIITRDELIP